MHPTLKVGNVIREVLSTYRDQARILLPIALGLYLAVDIVNLFAQGNPAISLVSFAVSIVVIALYQGIVVGLVCDLKEGQSDFWIPDLIRAALAVVLPLIGAGLLWELGIAVGFLLLIVPGLILITIWAVVVPAIVIEGAGVFEAFGRSRELVRGSGWPVFGVIMLGVLITSVVFLPIIVVSLPTIHHSGSHLFVLPHRSLSYIALSVVGSAVIAPVWPLIEAILYYRLLAVEDSGQFAVDGVDGGPPPGHWSRFHRITDPAKRPRALNTASWFALGGLMLIGVIKLIELGTAVALYGGTEPAHIGDLSEFLKLHRTFVRWQAFSLLGYGLAAIVFISWFGMAYANLGRLGVKNLRWSNGWAVGAWFVPILNLFRPKQIANDIWRGSEPDIEVSSNRWQFGQVTPIIHWWWGLFLLGGFTSYIGGGIVASGYRGLVQAIPFGLDSGPDLAKIRTGLVIDIVDCAVLVAAATLGVIVVRKTTDRFESLRRITASAERSPVAGHISMVTPSASASPEGGADPLPGSEQDLISCPECAEFVVPHYVCPYCGYRFSG